MLFFKFFIIPYRFFCGHLNHIITKSILDNVLFSFQKGFRFIDLCRIDSITIWCYIAIALNNCIYVGRCDASTAYLQLDNTHSFFKKMSSKKQNAIQKYMYLLELICVLCILNLLLYTLNCTVSIYLNQNKIVHARPINKYLNTIHLIFF